METETKFEAWKQLCVGSVFKWTTRLCYEQKKLCIIYKFV